MREYLWSWHVNVYFFREEKNLLFGIWVGLGNVFKNFSFCSAFVGRLFSLHRYHAIIPTSPHLHLSPSSFPPLSPIPPILHTPTSILSHPFVLFPKIFTLSGFFFSAPLLVQDLGMFCVMILIMIMNMILEGCLHYDYDFRGMFF